MIQSMNPASISGTSADMHSPAGDSAPDSESPTVTFGSSIFDVNSLHASRRRPALYDRNASSTSCVSVVLLVRPGGSMRLWLILCRYFCGGDFFIPKGYGGEKKKQSPMPLARRRASE